MWAYVGPRLGVAVGFSPEFAAARAKLAFNKFSWTPEPLGIPRDSGDPGDPAPLSRQNHQTQKESVEICPRGSMYGIYMLTWLGYIDGIHVTIYGSTIDPMGVGIMFIQIGYYCSIISRSSWQIDANRIKLRWSLHASFFSTGTKDVFSPNWGFVPKMWARPANSGRWQPPVSWSWSCAWAYLDMASSTKNPWRQFRTDWKQGYFSFFDIHCLETVSIVFEIIIKLSSANNFSKHRIIITILSIRTETFRYNMIQHNINVIMFSH